MGGSPKCSECGIENFGRFTGNIPNKVLINIRMGELPLNTTKKGKVHEHD